MSSLGEVEEEGSPFVGSTTYNNINKSAAALPSRSVFFPPSKKTILVFGIVILALFVMGTLAVSMLSSLSSTPSPTKQKEESTHAVPNKKTGLSNNEEEEYLEDQSMLEDDDDEDEEEVDIDALEEEEEDSSVETMHAPRSRPDLEYNEIKPRGILYWPSGGMSNQILEMENALHMAHLLNRTLYVSQIGSHNYLMAGYNKLSNDKLFPADRLLDFDLMSRWADVVPLNISTKKFVQSFPRDRVFEIRSEFASFGPYSIDQLRQRKDQLLLWSGHSMYRRWFSKEDVLLVQRHMAYSPYLRNLAIRLAKRAMKNEPFYAIHGRLGDEAYKWEDKTARDVFMNNRVYRSWNKTLKIYLASDCPHCSFFSALRRTGRIVTLADLTELEEMHEFSNLFQNERVRKDNLGILDKLMCAQALDFQGSKFSTFSWDIWRYRTMLDSVFPELKSP